MRNLLGAFVLRTVLVPAVMTLCGRANWWLPRWLDRHQLRGGDPLRAMT
jgi:uncharacterized membrane protein YdfJ with MMPL/SSD domain